MNRKALLSACLAVSAAGCSANPVRIKVDEINGFTARGARSAVFGLNVTRDLGVDLDGDGVADLDLNEDGVFDARDTTITASLLFLVASDSEALCDNRTGGIALADEISAEVLAIKLDPAGGAGGFAPGELLRGNDLSGAAPLFVGAAFVVFEGGALKVNAFSGGLGALSIDAIDETFSGAAEDTLIVENAAGEDAEISADFAAAFRDVSACDGVSEIAAGFLPLIGLAPGP
jgi:hypothetical protein